MKVLEQGAGGKEGAPLPVSDVEIGAGELWLPAKELNDVLYELMRSPDPSEQLIQDVDRVLTWRAADFASLFAIKPPSPVDRDQLQKCSTEGRYLKGFMGKHVISYNLVNEASMLSDMFQINEFIALDLLTVAENELDNYPNWPRGLVAVLQFYEGRLYLLRALCTLLRCSPGRQWTSHFHPQVLLSFKRVLNSVFREDLMDRLITLLENFSLEKQRELLENNLALGDSRHRRKVKSLLNEIKETLAQTIFCYAAQRGLRWPELARILDYLKSQINLKERPVTKGDATLLATALYTIDTLLCPPDTDLQFGAGLRKYLKDNQDAAFKCPELHDLLQLAFLIAANKLQGGNSPPHSPRPSSSRHVPGPSGDTSFLGGDTPRRRDGDQVMLTLLGNDPGDMDFTSRNFFGFLRTQIFAHPAFYTWDADIAKVFHGFFVDFLVYMPMKLKEIKYRSEENARTLLICQEQGISHNVTEVPAYEAFLECLGEFYEHDPFELGRYFFLEQSEYLPLARLVRMACMESPALFPSCVKFLAGIATGNTRATFDLLREGGHNASLEHFFDSIQRYLQNLGLPLSPAGISPMEVESIASYLHLLQVICAREETARHFFVKEKSHWIRTALQVVKVPSFPREVRAAMLTTVAAMIGEEPLSPEVVTNLWDIFYGTRLLEPGTGDVKEELEEKETRVEDYSLTLGVLRLFRALIKCRLPTVEYVSMDSYFVTPTHDNGALFQYIGYLTDAVFLKMPYRMFKDPNQRWVVMRLCAETLSVLIDYVPKLMTQLLCDSPLIRTLLNSIVDCALASDFTASETQIGFREEVEQCSLSLLVLLWRALQRQQFYLMKKQELMDSRDTGLLLGIHKIMLSTANQGGAPDYILSVVRFVDALFSSAEHMRAALEILSAILEDHTDIDYIVHHALLWHEGIASVFRHSVVEILYGAGSEPEPGIQDTLKISALKLIRTSAVHTDPNVGLFLMSFDVRKREYSGGRTVLHALLDNAIRIPTSFETLLTLMTDPRLSEATLRVLRYSKFFPAYLREGGVLQEMSYEGLSHFLKCLAIELKAEEGVGEVASDLVGDSFPRLEEILNMIQLESKALELPDLEFFDEQLVIQAIQQCEYLDEEMKAKLVRVEQLEGMLKEEIGKLEKSTALRLRKTVHSEAKRIVEYAGTLNQRRMREGCKLLVVDGWRQVVEVLALHTPQLGNTDFCPMVLRMLLTKVVSGTGGLTEYFLRMAAETTLTLSAVMAERSEVSGTALSMVIHHLCQWLQSAQNPNVRGILYASLLYCVNMLGAQEGVGFESVVASHKAFPMILHNLCKDCCQGAGVRTRMQALYLMGEIIKGTTQRGFGRSGGAQFAGESVEGDAGVSAASSLSWLMTPNPNFGGDSNISLGGGRMEEEKSGGRRTTGVHEIIMNCVYTNGFLSTLVEALCVVDDIDLTALLTSGSQEASNLNAMRAFFVFEAKLTMLSRLAGVGIKAVMHLLDLNLIKRLTDMKVFELQSYQQYSMDDVEASRVVGGRGSSGKELEVLYSHGQRQGWLQTMGSPLAQSTPKDQQRIAEPGSRFPPRTPGEASGEVDPVLGRHTISESLYIQVFKLFHGMLDSAPRNVQVLQQILQFLGIHDSALSKLLSPARVGLQESPRHASHLLTSLLTKLAKNAHHFQMEIFTPKSTLKPGLLNILRMQAERNFARGDQVATTLVKQCLLFLFYCGKLERTGSGGNSSQTINVVLTNRFELDTMLRDQEENVSLGVVLQVVVWAAQNIASSQVKDKKTQAGITGSSLATPAGIGGSTSAASREQTFLTNRMLEDCQSIVEVGLTLVFFHVQLFLQEMRVEKELKRGNRLAEYQEQLESQVEGNLAKVVAQACKKIEREEFIETLLLKIRRLASSTRGPPASSGGTAGSSVSFGVSGQVPSFPN